MPKSTNKDIELIKEEFNRVFGDYFSGKWSGALMKTLPIWLEDKNELWSFIESKLKSQKEEFKKMVEGMSEGVRRNESGLRTDTVMDDIEDAREDGYLQALTDILEKIG